MLEKKILRASDVCSLLSISPATLYRWVRQGLFPRGFKFGGRTAGWTSETVQKWLEDEQKKVATGSVPGAAKVAVGHE